ncbi:MAG: efflux RND transporter periplasmic adaptor subunit [Verrucomicrobiales bacterium]|jgi:multidrug efflux system membrane fusion protein|nr:efflux RND transporter periplasmic adaptor subunit [Verrucomicrobiales bacterium]
MAIRKSYLVPGAPALLLAGLLVVACGRKQEAPPPRPPVLVTTARAASQNVPLYLDEIGTCQALQSVLITPQVSGPVTAIHFQDGQEVRLGDPLYTIDPRPYAAAVQQAEARLSSDRATLAYNQAQLQRNENLVAGDFISAQDLENLKTTVAVNQAAVQADEAALATAKINLGYCQITAPIDGKTGAHQVDIGNVVTAYSNAALVSIQRMDPMYVDFIVAEVDLPRVREYFKHGTLKVKVSFPDDERKSRHGDLYFLDNVVRAGSGTVLLRAIMPNQDRLFWPGQFVKVQLVLTELPDAVLVPAGAVQIGHSGPYVFVVKPDLTVDLRLVTPGQRQGDLVVLAHGVAAGETVVLDGQLMLSPGAQVRVVTPPAATPASAAGADPAAPAPTPAARPTDAGAQP